MFPRDPRGVFPGVLTLCLGVICGKVSGWVFGEKRHIRFQIWVQLIFGIVCGSFLSSTASMFENCVLAEGSRVPEGGFRSRFCISGKGNVC